MRKHRPRRTDIAVTDDQAVKHTVKAAPAYYAMAAGLVGVIAVACMKETANKPLAGSPPSVETTEEAADLVHAQSPEPKF